MCRRYHTESGIAVVSVLTAHAFGDMYGFERWVNRFLELSTQPCENLDITLGRSGSVLATSLSLDAWRAVSAEPAEGLADFGNRTLAGIWNELDQLPPIADERKIGYLGIAHRWAGFAYAALRWRKSAGGQLPPGVETRLANWPDVPTPRRTECAGPSVSRPATPSR
jgi:serine/threonine-protein kinase